VHVLASGLDPVDEHIGGLPTGSLVQVYGPAGAGKSSLALTVARETAPACLILAERLHKRRVGDVLGPEASKLLVARPGTMAEQREAMTKAGELLREGRISAVVLDSLTFLYRFEQSSSTEALRAVFDHIGRLHSAARAGDGLALVTNQVRGAERGVDPIGGPGVKHASDVILRLEDGEGAWRRLVLEKHPYEAPGAAGDVTSTRDGVA
jgi:RecA/RadA recombinase